MQCMVIMPFRADFDIVFATVNRAAGRASGDLQCYWLKDFQGAGKITDDIVLGIGTATLCVADLTGNNPNVMWETGYAMALGRPVILIGQSIQAIPFDLHNHRLLEYHANHIDELEQRLVRAFEQTLAQIQHDHLTPRPANLYWLGHDLARAIRYAMFELTDRVELEKCLLFALHHLEQIELPNAASRQLLLQALARCKNPALFSADEQAEFVGWIAQAKNDLGDAIAHHQRDFVAYPTPPTRKRIIGAAQSDRAEPS